MQKSKERRENFMESHDPTIPIEIIYSDDTSTPNNANKYRKVIDDEYFKKEAERLEQNKTESYTTWEMIQIFVFGPLNFFRWYDDVFTLRKENYFLKFKQRIIILTLGFIAWFFFIYTSFHYYEQKRLEEIEKVDISDWKKKHGYE